MKNALRPWLLVALVGACSSTGTETGASSDAAAPTPVAPPGALTYWQDVRPLLEEKCVGCHKEGGIAPFRLSDYASARSNAAMIVAATGSRTMPPWPPGPLSPQLQHDRSLSAEKIKLLADWVSGGSWEGDAANAAPLPATRAVELPSVDLQKDIGVDYTPPSDVRDEYRCFLIELGTTEDRVSVGFRLTPGNASTVHHVITSLFDASAVDALRAIDAETPDRAGWSCSGGPVPTESEAKIKPVGSLGSWVPGVLTVMYPEGTGSPIPKGAVAVMQIHYNIHGTPSPDRTKIEVALAPKGQEPALKLATLRNPSRQISIPAGAKDVVSETTKTARELAGGRFFPDKEAKIRMVSGHMHMVGVHFSLNLERAGGEKTTLLDIPAWDFHWQGSYELKTPIPLGPDDKVTVRCVYDNTAEHLKAVGYPEAQRLVTWGEGSGDEMCIGYLTLTD